MNPPHKQSAVLVVGAGVAGMQAALDLADMGVKVFLLDRAPVIGGAVAQLERTFPEGQSSSCEVGAMVDAVSHHPNIELITNADLQGISGEQGSFDIAIKKRAFRVTEKCDGCGACYQVCPVKPYNTFNEGLTLRCAIDHQNYSFLPLIYNIEKETPACQETCPVHIDIRRYVGLIAEEKFLEALQVIRERNPLPSICGRVCHHPCEGMCNRGQQDEPIAIEKLKRFAADYEMNLRRQGLLHKPPAPKKPTKEKVAVVGAGPAGLTCGHDLAKLGYEVTIFEKESVPGGMLYLCIPEYRLPRDVIEYDVDSIRDSGVDIRLSTPIGKELTLDDLRKQGYKAIFMGIGAHRGLKLRVPGEDEFEGFIDCIEFLKQVNLGDKSKPGKKAIVIGGGNSAIDSARVALRLGCEEVYILYRRSRKEMPANEWEVEEAEHEGVQIHYLAAPVKILGKNGRVAGMECTKMELGKLDASGRRRPIPIKGSEFTIEADVIIPAISQQPDISFLSEGHGLEISRWDSFVINERTMQTNLPDVFAGGDAVTGPATVIEAIAAGHRAATGIDRYLRER